MVLHSFKVGDEVFVLNRKPSGRFFVEGKAKIVRAIAGDEDRYMVRFSRGPSTERYVDPSAQDDPEGFVAALNAA